MQLGYSTWGMPTVPIDVILEHLAQVGFDRVEIAILPRYTTALGYLDSAERQRIAHLITQSGLKLSAISSYLSMIEPDPALFAHNLAQVQGAIDLAVDWAQEGEPPIVITGIAGQPGELEPYRAQLVDRLNALGDYAQKRGVTVALEPHVLAAVEMPDQMIGVLQQVTSPAVRVNFDISHFNVLGIPIEESVAKMIPYTVHTHVKDERGRSPTHEYLIPGEGEFDYVRYLRALQAYHYTGVVSVEISMMVQRRPHYDPLATATHAYQVLSRAFMDAEIARDRAR